MRLRKLGQVFLIAVLAVSASAPRIVRAQAKPVTPARTQANPVTPAGETPAASQAAQQSVNDESNVSEPADSKDEFRISKSTRWLADRMHMKPKVAATLFELINFATLFLAITWFVSRFLPKTIGNRRARIERQMNEARVATEDATARLSAIESRLASLDDEIIAIRQRTEREAAVEEERIKDSIERERQKIVADSEQEIASAGIQAQHELKRFAAELAIAEAMRRAKVDASADKAIIEDFTAKLAGSGHGSKN
jgi:F-type H+-transporting ATPase subunit b